jgi:transcriptional regulator with XRE-family HTH domain
MREQRGWSQTQLARAAGMTQPAIARFEADGTAPTLPVVERIAPALGADLAVRITPRTESLDHHHPTRDPRRTTHPTEPTEALGSWTCGWWSCAKVAEHPPPVSLDADPGTGPDEARTDPGTVTCSSTKSPRPARSASVSTGASPAHDTRFGSSNTAVYS